MKELYPSVEYYGIGDIIRDYCGFSNCLPLPVSMQHGWTLMPVQHDALKNVGENWYWSKDIEFLYRRKFPGIKTRAVGAPFIYHLKNIGYQEIPIEKRKGSIVFPAHSSEYVSVAFDYEAYAEMLDNLPAEYKPLTVCMYHLDQEKGMDRSFREKGFTVVTNGKSLYEKSFLDNYVYNTKDKLYAFSNEPTSALIYASLMGLTAFYYGPSVEELLVENPPKAELSMFEERKSINDHWQMYFKFPDCDRNQQQGYCELVAGMDVIYGKNDLRFLLYKILLSSWFLFTLFLTLLSRCKIIVYIYRKIKIMYIKK